ncbi:MULTISPECIES: tetratricopeptide repeat protein [unclassified Thermotoga]|uniref:tetratricopeptide repeat protein n=1 Tax=unclassified Thermotoga TaxID=2631113 RepID=UPI00054450B9|nr:MULTISPECIES: tetratricopeptide repeat protein [unclassified Thermotoga]KAF2959083.1 hypothetical protein AS158_08535 [Thermotoga sp. 38H-to]KHC90917.1 hypothetical protein Mc24_06863 [Thermotoga sp. Mc24]
MNVLEKIVRDLISEKRITEARNLLSLFPEEFPHLELEVEYAARNWKAVKRLYENLPDEFREKYKEYYEYAMNQLNIDYSKETEEALKEMERKNFQGAASILESIVKDYPELVEVIALRYKLALQRNEKRAIEKYRKLLLSLDRTHPALIETKVSSRRIGVFEVFTLSLLVALLVTTILAFYILPSRIEVNVPSSESEVNIKPVEQRIEDILANIVVLTENLGKINDSLEENFSVLQENMSSISENIESLREALTNLESRLSRIESAVAKTSSEEPSVSVVYVTAREDRIERAKGLWFLGYMFYLRRDYDEAINRFEVAIKEVGEDDVYFKDDVYYYRALSYYYKGDTSTARSLFEEFIKLFPDSEYADDAEYFLKRL